VRKLLSILLFLLVTQVIIAQDSPPASLLIAGGTVVDGTGAKGKREDVRVVGDHIAEIGKLTPRPGERVIEAKGLVVAPGIIDTHSHADGGLLDMPDAETQIRQGITTSVVGQDGSSHFPLADWFRLVEEKHVAINIASFVGHGTVRLKVMGKDYKRATTPEEQEKMAALVAQEMRSGALGVSSGLEYDPGFYSTTEELIACAKAAAPYGGLYISHVRDEGNEALKSFRELIRIAQEGHLPAQISHIKLDTAPAWGKAGEALRLMDEANRHGLDITADVYPYLFWQSTITVLIPSRDWENRALWEKGLADVGGASHVRLTSYSANAAWAGKTIAEIAGMTQQDPVSVVQEIVHRSHAQDNPGSESVVVTAMTEEDLRKFLTAKRIMFSTDGGLRGTHPRGAGSYPRILGRYVREQHLLSLEEAVRKMTSLPAWRMGFHDRGQIKVGMRADLILFDPAKVLDMATIEQPTAPPVGLPYVLVNGVPVLDNERLTGAHPGAVLRHQASATGH
jgi:N-acyl-D-amino-acid deacylase